MHRTLARQLRKLGLSLDKQPPLDVWAKFVASISQVYVSQDEDRYLIERSIEISSSEMRALTTKLADRNTRLQAEIDQHAKTTDKLRYAATHDQLTGLPNRTTMLGALAKCLEQAKSDHNSQFALLFVDLDDFKLINDSLGHDIGDQVLMMLADRLHGICTALDKHDPLVCRLGGDEFVILLGRIESQDTAIEIVDRIRETLELAFELTNHRLVVGASVGLLMGDHRYQEPAALLRDADTAMYRAKVAGKGGCAVFNADMHEEMVARMRLEQELRMAIENREFIMVYQPIIETESGLLKGFESLVRWKHPSRGILSPAVFIDLAEETGLIVPIGCQIIDEVCNAVAEWQNSGANIDNLKFSINVSKRQITDETLLNLLLNACQRFGVKPDKLIIEITESCVMTDSDRVIDMLGKIRENGFQVYMDDFGTGMSSLSTLHHMPFDAVKIDQSFVRDISGDRDNAAIIMSIVMLAHNLGLKVVAEGIEEPEQLAHLQACECDYGQGYLFSRPIPKDEVLGWIHSEKFDWHQHRCA